MMKCLDGVTHGLYGMDSPLLSAKQYRVRVRAIRGAEFGL